MKKQLQIEIQHILESGADEICLMNLLEREIKKAFKVGEDNVEFAVLYGHGRLTDADKYFDGK